MVAKAPIAAAASSTCADHAQRVDAEVRLERLVAADVADRDLETFGDRAEDGALNGILRLVVAARAVVGVGDAHLDDGFVRRSGLSRTNRPARAVLVLRR